MANDNNDALSKLVNNVTVASALRIPESVDASLHTQIK
jgi:hypothetical protein